MKFKLAALLLVLVSVSSCRSNILQVLAKDPIPEEVRKSAITFHYIDSTRIKSRLVTAIKVGGQTFGISKIPVLSNRDIVFAEPYLYRNGQYGIKMRLTHKGRMQWKQVSGERRGQRGVMAVGGHFKCYMYFGDGFDGPEFRVPAPLSKKEAEEISRIIIRNYEAIKENS